MNYYDQYDEYLEEMLQVQYNVSEIINHKLTRGEVREDFIKYQINKQFPNIGYYKGVLVNSDGDKQTGQLDIIIAQSDARIRKFGSHSMVNVNDCKMVIEVKSNATTRDFKKFNDTANEISGMCGKNSAPLCGMFCYNINMSCSTLLKKFGYNYDREIKAFVYNNSNKNIYNNIDFILCLDVNEDKNIEDIKKFFIIKDRNLGIYNLFRDIPVSKYFFRLFS